MNKSESIKILKAGIIQRQQLLENIVIDRKKIENQSDFGWLMTLGADKLGMLIAVANAKKARELIETENKLRREINILKETVQKIQ